MGIVPTLFIALGGTGAEISLRLRRRILTHEWGYDDRAIYLDFLEEFPLAQFIHYDLAFDGGYHSTDGPERFKEHETLISRLDTEKYFRNDEELYRYPCIEDWFPCSRRLICNLGIDPSKGTGQLRWLSRLYFFDKYHVLKNMIECKIHSLLDDVTNIAKLERLGLQQETASIRIVIVASTAGGTGSGSFLDMSYLTKWLATKYCLRAEVNLFLMLPGGFKNAGRTRTEANTYAALMELETCIQQGALFPSRWKVDEDPDLPRTPFDNIFLFDSTNLVRRKVEAVSDLYDMAADVLFEELTSPFTGGSRHALRLEKMQYKLYPFNILVDSEKYGSLKIKYAKSYSSFGRSVCNIQFLETMPTSERMTLFYDCLAKAMPRVDATIEESWFDHPYKYICIVNVNGAQEFEKRFGNEFRSVVPSNSGLTPLQIRFRESSEAGKIICYVELIGMPLLALNNLPDWRISYEKENMKIPVHIHKDKSLFVHPIPPTMVEFERLAEDFKLFIQGIALGVLALTYSHEKLYCISICGELRHISNERLIRLEGLNPSYYKKLNELVSNILDRIRTPSQLAALVVLYDFYAQHVYLPTIIQEDSLSERLEGGFCHVMCRKLGENARQSLRRMAPGAEDELIVRLGNVMEIWTEVIEGSEADVYEYEVGRGHAAKRRVKKEFFKAGWLDSIVSVKALSGDPKCCVHCGEQTALTSRFCPNCGRRFDDMPPPLPPL